MAVELCSRWKKTLKMESFSKNLQTFFKTIQTENFQFFFREIFCCFSSFFVLLRCLSSFLPLIFIQQLFILIRNWINPQVLNYFFSYTIVSFLFTKFWFNIYSFSALDWFASFISICSAPLAVRYALPGMCHLQCNIF